MGFDFEYKISTQGLTELDFCKQYFYECPGTETGWVMFKNPGSQLFKLGISTKAPANHRSKRTYELIRSKVYSLCAEAYGLQICDVALSMLRQEDSNPTFEQTIDAHRQHNPDAEQWTLCAVHAYGEVEQILYSSMYGDELERLQQVFCQWQNEPTESGQADERRQFYQARDYPILFDLQIKNSQDNKKPKTTDVKQRPGSTINYPDCIVAGVAAPPTRSEFIFTPETTMYNSNSHRYNVNRQINRHNTNITTDMQQRIQQLSNHYDDGNQRYAGVNEESLVQLLSETQRLIDSKASNDSYIALQEQINGLIGKTMYLTKPATWENPIFIVADYESS